MGRYVKKNKIYIFKQKLKRYELANKLNKIRNILLKKGNDKSEAFLIDDAEHVTIHFPNNIEKPKVGVVYDGIYLGETLPTAYWPKYKRFLDYNEIPYGFINMNRSTWIEDCINYDIIAWHVSNEPSSLEDAQTKIYLLENYYNKTCYPSQKEIWFYEDKIKQHYLFRILGIPTVETFITNDDSEALRYIQNLKFPIVSKIKTGSESKGVKLITNRKEASKHIDKVFLEGEKTYWTYLKQKDYVYYQHFLADALYDLRVIGVGNKYFGYFRLRPKDDFRASGAGIYEKKEIPYEVLEIARSVKEALRATLIAVDLICSEKDKSYKVIEASIFIRVDTPEQLKVNGVPGYYQYDGGKFTFKPGRYWVQELALNEVIGEWVRKRGDGQL